jgi:hypothetical protein
MKVAFVILVLAGSALAQNEEDRLAADTLFNEAKDLAAKGDYAAACPKLEASMKIIPRLGTELNLADCHAKQGMLAYAWAEYNDAASLAAKSNDSRQSYARDQAKALEPRLSHLTIVAPPGLSGLEVKRDDVVVNAALVGSAMPVNQGDHVITATAKGKPPLTQTVTISGEGTSATVELFAPKKTAEPPPPPVPTTMNTTATQLPPPPPPMHEHEPTSGMKIAGFSAIGVGGLAIGGARPRAHREGHV